MHNRTIKVSIVDDHPIVIDGLQMMLEDEEEIEIVAMYATGQQLLDGIKNLQCDILVLDVKLPDIPGDELIIQVLQKHPKTKILVMSYLDNLYYVKTMMRLGALGYVLKTSGKEVVIAAIKSVSRGEQYIESQLKEKLVQNALLSRKESRVGETLTRREMEVLQLIATNLTSQQMADRLYLSLKTIEFHRSNLLAKLKVKNAASLVKKAMQMNLLGD